MVLSVESRVSRAVLGHLCIDMDGTWIRLVRELARLGTRSVMCLCRMIGLDMMRLFPEGAGGGFETCVTVACLLRCVENCWRGSGC